MLTRGPLGGALVNRCTCQSSSTAARQRCKTATDGCTPSSPCATRPHAGRASSRTTFGCSRLGWRGSLVRSRSFFFWCRHERPGRDTAAIAGTAGRVSVPKRSAPSAEWRARDPLFPPQHAPHPNRFHSRPLRSCKWPLRSSYRPMTSSHRPTRSSRGTLGIGQTGPVGCPTGLRIRPFVRFHRRLSPIRPQTEPRHTIYKPNKRAFSTPSCYP